jgi:hypothetical protein
VNIMSAVDKRQSIFGTSLSAINAKAAVINSRAKYAELYCTMLKDVVIYCTCALTTLIPRLDCTQSLDVRSQTTTSMTSTSILQTGIASNMSSQLQRALNGENPFPGNGERRNVTRVAIVNNSGK